MRSMTVKLPEKSYDIYIENGLLNHIGNEIEKIYKGTRIAVITDIKVDGFYGEVIKESLEEKGYLVHKIVLSPGEKSKSIEVLLEVYDELLDFGITRGDLIIALGGGVVGDLGGFAASTLLRGIPYVQLPTSLLAQVDSSVGGKVAIDLPRGKNLVGSFYHPEAVFIDPLLLKTLDRRFLSDGMAEVIKYGCIRDKNLFEKLMDIKGEDELLANMEEIIHRCCSIKKDVVERDEKDNGERMILNFGHTIGHAIEKYNNFEEYTHGEAVALGMYMITKASEEEGITEIGTAEEIKNILRLYNLPIEFSALNRDKLIETTAFDKKSKGEYINIILLREIGECMIKRIKREEISKYILPDAQDLRG